MDFGFDLLCYKKLFIGYHFSKFKKCCAYLIHMLFVYHYSSVKERKKTRNLNVSSLSLSKAKEHLVQVVSRLSRPRPEVKLLMWQRYILIALTYLVNAFGLNVYHQDILDK